MNRGTTSNLVETTQLWAGWPDHAAPPNSHRPPTVYNGLGHTQFTPRQTGTLGPRNGLIRSGAMSLNSRICVSNHVGLLGYLMGTGNCR